MDYDEDDYDADDFVDEKDVPVVSSHQSARLEEAAPPVASCENSESDRRSSSKGSSRSTSHSSKYSSDASPTSPGNEAGTTVPQATRTTHESFNSVASDPEEEDPQYSDDDEFEESTNETQIPKPSSAAPAIVAGPVVLQNKNSGDLEFIVGKAPKHQASTVQSRHSSNGNGSVKSTVHSTKDLVVEPVASSPSASISTVHTSPSPTKQSHRGSIGGTNVVSPVSPPKVLQPRNSVSPQAATPPRVIRRASSVRAETLPEDDSSDEEPAAAVKKRTGPVKKSLPAAPTLAHQPPPAKPLHLPRVAKRPTARPASKSTPHNNISDAPHGHLSKELQRLIQQRDQLRRDVTDLKLALDDPHAHHGAFKEGQARLRFFQVLEEESKDMAIQVQQLKRESSGAQNVLSDRLHELSRYIAAKQNELKGLERDRRKAVKEIKTLTKTASGDEQTAVDELFIKRCEELVGEGDTNRQRHERHMDELREKLGSLEDNLETVTEQTEKVHADLEQNHVARMEQHEFVSLQKRCDANKKRVSQLKQALAGLDYAYEAPASVAEWHDKRVEQQAAEITHNIQQLVKQIKQKETVIMTNYNIGPDLRPSHFVDPSDSDSMPAKGDYIVPPPLPVVPATKPRRTPTSTATPTHKPRPPHQAAKKPPARQPAPSSSPHTAKRGAAPKHTPDRGGDASNATPSAPTLQSSKPSSGNASRDGKTKRRSTSEAEVRSDSAAIDAPRPASLCDSAAASPQSVESAAPPEEELVANAETISSPGHSHPDFAAVHHDDGEQEDAALNDYGEDEFIGEDENAVEEECTAVSNANPTPAASTLTDGGATTQPSRGGESHPADEVEEEEIPPWLTDD